MDFCLPTVGGMRQESSSFVGEMFALWTEIKSNMINSGQKCCAHSERPQLLRSTAPWNLPECLEEDSVWKVAHVVNKSLCVCVHACVHG